MSEEVCDRCCRAVGTTRQWVESSGQVCGANEGPDADVDCLERALARRTTLLREVGEALREVKVYADEPRGPVDPLEWLKAAAVARIRAHNAILRIDAEVGDASSA